MAAARVLIRISGTFGDLADEILDGLPAGNRKRLGPEYFLIDHDTAGSLRDSPTGKFVRWQIPVEHGWPCNPGKMEGFIEKAAQGLAKKFGGRAPQAILIGPLDGADAYYKKLASNLRGRLLQVFPDAGHAAVEDQEPRLPTLYCLVGEEGLFAGMASPLEANGFYPGGTKFIKQGSAETISRAGAKIAEALHYLKLFVSPPPAGTHWLELGASPGGMTSELLARGYRVTAVDRAVLDKRLDKSPGLEFSRTDVADFHPRSGVVFDALLSDMNGEPREALRQVLRLSRHLKAGGLVVFTLKTTGEDSVKGINELHRLAIEDADRGGLEAIATTHLTYNRQEFTLLFRKRS
jgi:23S rRNA (cytidine2498-2'-O)-methyltransferase